MIPTHSKKPSYDGRRFPRLNLELPIHYKYFENGKLFRALEAIVENVSAMGLAAENDRYMHKGQHLMTTLFIPDENLINAIHGTLNEEECKPVFVLSKIIWCAHDASTKYSFGVEFVQIEEEHKRRLKNFLMTHDLYKTKVL